MGNTLSDSNEDLPEDLSGFSRFSLNVINFGKFSEALMGGAGARSVSFAC
jgi:hypothetical protein